MEVHKQRASLFAHSVLNGTSPMDHPSHKRRIFMRNQKRNITFDFSDYHVVITGGASGIGQSTAIEFAKAGAKVAVIDRDPATETEAKAAALGLTIQSYQADVSSGEQMEAVGQEILNAFDNRVDVLFSATPAWDRM